MFPGVILASLSAYLPLSYSQSVLGLLGEKDNEGLGLELPSPAPAPVALDKPHLREPGRGSEPW